MSWEDRVADWFEDGETRSLALKWGWILSLGFLLFGYGAIAYYLFF